MPDEPQRAGSANQTSLVSGIIVMLDALGASNFTEKETVEYIEKITHLSAAWQKNLGIMTTFGKVFGTKDPQSGTVAFENPETIYFGDTVVLAWSIPGDPENLLTACATWVVSALCMAMEKGLLLRGAISIGKYLLKDNIIIGPAVADAASWYERAQWMGAFLTPGAGIKLERIINTADPLNPIWPFFVKYDVPLKNSKKQPSWVLAWPWNYYCPFRDTGIKHPREIFINYFSRFSVPPGTEAKYLNTLKFFDDYCVRYKSDWEELETLVKQERQKNK